jgi:hypothetical protein
MLLAAFFITTFPANAGYRIGHFRIGSTPAARIAKDPQIPGKGSYGKCLPFALALNKKFKAAGIPSQVIAYSYRTLAVPVDLTSGERSATRGARPGTVAAHAIVAYKDDGRTYIMDNQSWMPTWVHGGPPARLARQFSGMDVGVMMARVVRHAGPLNGLRVAGLPSHRNGAGVTR